MLNEIKMIKDVLNNGTSIKECREKDETAYRNCAARVSKARNEYLLKTRPQTLRTCYFITGGSEEDRRKACRYMAEAMAEKLAKESLEDDLSGAFFVIRSAGDVSLYDGQPVVYFDEVSPDFLDKSLGGKAGVLNFLNPAASRMDRCCGDTYGIYLPCNEMTLISSARPFESYVETLAKCIGGTTKQVAARFDAYIEVNGSGEDDFSYHLNVGHALQKMELYDKFSLVKEDGGKTWFEYGDKKFYAK